MPYGSNLHHSTLLSNVSNKYQNTMYVADKVFPALPVKHETNRILSFNADYRIPDTLRGVKAVANEYMHSYSYTSYAMQEHALKDLADDRTRENADPGIQLDIDITENLTDKILARREWETQLICFTTTTWANNQTYSSATSWRYSTTTATNPIIAGHSAASKILESSGILPNRMVMGFKTYNDLRDNTHILDRIKYSEKTVIAADLLAAQWDLESVHIGGAAYDQGAEGLTVSQTSIWQDKALFYYAPPRPGMRQISAGYMVQRSNAGQPYKVKRWRDENHAGNWVEVSTMFIPKAVMTAAAYLFAAVDI